MQSLPGSLWLQAKQSLPLSFFFNIQSTWILSVASLGKTGWIDANYIHVLNPWPFCQEPSLSRFPFAKRLGTLSTQTWHGEYSVPCLVEGPAWLGGLKENDRDWKVSACPKTKEKKRKCEREPESRQKKKNGCRWSYTCERKSREIIVPNCTVQLTMSIITVTKGTLKNLIHEIKKWSLLTHWFW